MIKVLLDTDANNGLDDQHAIAYLLLSGNTFRIEGLTVNRTYGGGNIEDQVREAERVVRLCGLDSQLEVTRGASASFDEIAPHLTEDQFDGAAAVNLIIERAQAADWHELVLLPIGKLTNVALALKKEPAIAAKVRVVWLGSNYPDDGEYNQDNDEGALNYILDLEVDFEIAVVRYDKTSGTAAVRVSPQDIRKNLAGKGPQTNPPVMGRHGGSFDSFGDYSINLFENGHLRDNPPSRSLFDLAAVAIVKNPDWAEARLISAPTLEQGSWRDRPENPRKIVLWENFDSEAIIGDFFAVMENYRQAEVSP